MTDLILDPGCCDPVTGEGEAPQEEAGEVLPLQVEGVAAGRQTHDQPRGRHSASRAGDSQVQAGGEGRGQQ